MISENEARDVVGCTAYTPDGDKIGKVGQLYLDDQTGRPEFVTVNTGLFGTNESFVPVSEATFSGDRLTVPYDKAKIKDAPNVNVEDGHLDEADERRLYEFYGRSYGGGQDSQSQHDASHTKHIEDTKETTDTGRHPDAYRDAESRSGSDARHDDAGSAEGMTRSEETLRVGKTTQEAGRVRLRKYVTTETETHTVPVRKEKAVLEREPVTDANAHDATSGADISEGEHEVVLNEERVTVDKEVKPVERVRLGTETTTDEETVSEEVRKEHIDTDGDVDERS